MKSFSAPFNSLANARENASRPGSVHMEAIEEVIRPFEPVESVFFDHDIAGGRG